MTAWRIWMLFVVAPAALMSGYGFLYDQGSTGTPALFQSLAAVIPIGWWGVGWMVCGLVALAGGTLNEWVLMRVASSLGAALSTGLLISVVYARWFDNVMVSFVGLSWVWFMFSAFVTAIVWEWRRPA